MMIAGQIATLLSHYWSTNEDPTLRKAQANDWLADLEEFPASVVSESCAMWRRTESRRPTPADIRKLCLEVRPRSPAPPNRPALEHHSRLPDHVVRDNWRDLRVSDWTKAELAIANRELDEKASAAGMTRTEYAKSNLDRRYGAVA